ncbi:MBG domain-containing protein [Eggerthella sp. YY7918]|uniref:MBG domain-containing protein n=1 Tax=Eggerthella sp. (strain YY7918) TaxID=502558 RepID=UPI00021712D4|nr:MBG domain-containing protein [Eggerthella sp. YY7918]BAK44217.1 hypothetical protein EGYY_10390 [Eggerthella sp. YY7918]
MNLASRALAVLSSVALVFGLMPTAAFATPDPEPPAVVAPGQQQNPPLSDGEGSNGQPDENGSDNGSVSSSPENPSTESSDAPETIEPPAPAPAANTREATPREANPLAGKTPEQHDFGYDIGMKEAIPIETYEEFQAIGLPENLSGTYFLAEDIELSSSFDPIGSYSNNESFTGIFDGNGHTINFSVYGRNDGDRAAGLFSFIGTGSIVQRLKTKGSFLPYQEFSGTIAGVSWGEIRGCENNCSVLNVPAINVYQYTAGIVGMCQNSARIINCKNGPNATINGEHAAGIAGRVEDNPVIEDCENHATIKGSNAAGIIGEAYDSGHISGCTNYGNVETTLNYGSQWTGGVAGWMEGRGDNAFYMDYCENRGFVEVKPPLNPLDKTFSYCGGLVGLLTSSSEIGNCTNWGEVKTPHEFEATGGVVGRIADSSPMGLFSCAYNCVNNGYVNANGNIVGGVVGKSSSAVAFCANYGDVRGLSETGGVIGHMDSVSEAEYLINHGNVDGGGTTGGVIGKTDAKAFEYMNARYHIMYRGPEHWCAHLANYGNVSGGDVVGGVIGFSQGGETKELCSVGNVTGYDYVGGVVGRTGDDADLTESYSIGYVKGHSYVGGLVGDVFWSFLTASYTSTTVFASGEYVGAVTGDDNNGEFTDMVADISYNKDLNPDFPPSQKDRVHDCDAEEMVGRGLYNYIDGNIGFVPVDREHEWFVYRDSDYGTPYDEGSTIKAYYPQLYDFLKNDNPEVQAWLDTHRIKNESGHATAWLHDFDDTHSFEMATYLQSAEEVALISKRPSGRYLLSNDLDLGSNGYLRDVSFAGKIDGLGHTVTLGSNRGGLFNRAAEGSLVSNITLAGTITGKDSPTRDFIGGIANNVEGTIWKCTNRASVSDADNVGGIAGYVETSGLVWDSANEASVEGNLSAGGIAAETKGTIRRTTNAASLTAAQAAGGIAASATGSTSLIDDCKNTGAITAGAAGGIVAHTEGTVDSCKNHASVSSTSDAGGIAATAAHGSTISDALNKDTAQIAGNHATGGIVGISAGTLTECANEGTVEDPHVVGGIVGIMQSGSVLTYGRNETPLTGASVAGGIVGCSEFTDVTLDLPKVAASTNRGNVSGNLSQAGGIAGTFMGTIEGCANHATIGGDDTRIQGGIVGELAALNDTTFGIVKNCANSGTVGSPSGGDDKRAGGIVGVAQQFTAVDVCLNTGTIKSSDFAGGIVSEAQSTVSYHATIADCANFGPVYVTHKHAAGIAASLGYGTIERCYNRGAIMTSDTAPNLAGIASGAQREASLVDCYNAGAVASTTKGANMSGSGSVVARVGDTNPSMRACYYNTDMNEGMKGFNSNQLEDPHAMLGLTAEEMSDMPEGSGLGHNKMAFSDSTQWTYRDNAVSGEGGGNTITEFNYPQLVVLDQLYALPPHVDVPLPSLKRITVSEEDMQLNEEVVYSGEPVMLSAQFPGAPSYTIDHFVQIKSGEERPYSGTPYSVGTYKAYCNIATPLYEPQQGTITFTITKAPLTIKANDEHIAYGERQPEYSYEANLRGDDKLTGFGSVLGSNPEIRFSLSSSPDSNENLSFESVEPNQRYRIVLSVNDVTEWTDENNRLQANNYDVYVEGGWLDVTQEYDAADMYTIEGERGGNGHEDVFIGPVTLTPTPEAIAAGFNRITAEGGSPYEYKVRPWAENVVLDSVEQKTIAAQVQLQSSSGAVTSVDEQSFTICSKAAEIASTYPYRGSSDINPSYTTINFSGNQPVEKGTGNVYVHAADGTLFACVDVASDAVSINADNANNVIIELPTHFAPSTAYEVTSDETAFYTQSGRVMPAFSSGDWTFSTATYSVLLDVANVNAVYDGTAHAIVPTLTVDEGIDEPEYRVEYEGTAGTLYPSSIIPPVHPGTYRVTATVDDEDYKPATDTCTLTIAKREITLAADNLERLVGEQNPTLTFKATNLAEGEDVSVLDTVVWETTATSTSPVGTYPIAFVEASDNDYDITSTTDGVLTVKQDEASGRYAITGPTGAGHADRYVGTVHIAPTKAARDEGYDRISSDGGTTWQEDIVIESDEPREGIPLSVVLMKSTTGAVTSMSNESINVYGAPLDIDAISPVPGDQAHDPSDTTVKMRFSLPAEPGHGTIRILNKQGEEVSSVNVQSLRVRMAGDGLTATVHLPASLEPNTEYRVAMKSGTFVSRGWGQRSAAVDGGSWSFTTAASSDNVRITDVMLSVEGEDEERPAVLTSSEGDPNYTAAVVPLPDGSCRLTVTPVISGVVSDEMMRVEALSVVMQDGSSVDLASAVSVNGRTVSIASGVRNATVKVVAIGQKEQDEVTLKIVCTGWSASVVHNETPFSVKTSNLMAAINPDEIALADDEIAVVQLEVRLLDESAIDPDEAALIAEAGGHIAYYFDIDLFVTVLRKGDPSTELRRIKIDVAQRPIAFAFSLDDDPARANERVVRVHKDIVDTLPVVVTKDGVLLFTSDMFSTHALAYDIAHKVTVVPSEHGTVTADKERAVAGETVSLTATPAEGYRLDHIFVDGSALQGTSFEMPDADVVVAASFVDAKTPGAGSDTTQGGYDPKTIGMLSLTGDPTGKMRDLVALLALGGATTLLASTLAIRRRKRR